MSSNPIIITKSSSVGGSRGPRIPGVNPSVRYGEQVVSTGIPSLDTFVGGGIPLRTICIIKDSFPSRYSDCILKSFIAEGATYNHHLYVSSGYQKPEGLINELPALIPQKKSAEVSEDKSLLHETSESALKIAWRYGHQPQTSTGLPGGLKELNKFEFSNKSSASELGAKHIILSKVFESSSLCDITSEDLLLDIADVVKPFEIGSNIDTKSPNNLVRIALSHCEDQVLSLNFLRGLRALVRHTNSCALLTISDEAVTPSSMYRCEHFADYVISLQAVVDEKRRTELGDIDGICDVVKIASVNSLKPLEPPRDIGFSFKKKRLIFHELNLPPEGENTAQREVSNRPGHVAGNPSSSMCGVTIKGKSIDF